MSVKPLCYSNLKTTLGFSLIEISIVLFIVAVMSIGTVKGKQLLLTAKRVKAAATSQQISGMSGMVLWYDTFKTDSIDLERQRWQNLLPYGMDLQLPNNAEYSIVSSLKGRAYMPILCFQNNTPISIGNGYALGNYYTIVAVLATTSQTQAGQTILHTEQHDLQLIKGNTSSTDRLVLPVEITNPQADSYFVANTLFAMLISNGNRFQYQLFNPTKTTGIVNLNQHSSRILGKLLLDSNVCFLELLVFNRDLNDLEFNQLSNYLSDKYGFNY